MKRFLLWTASIVVIAYLLSVITGNGHMWNGLRQCWLRGYKNAMVDDLQFNETRAIPPSSTPRPWPLHSRYGSVEIAESVLDSTREQGTVALAVIHRDSLLLSWTSDVIEGADTMRTNSFSAAKSLTAMAIGVAEKDGLLSVQDKVSQYLPRFGSGPSADLTIEQVLQMRSDIPYGESYKDPFGFMARSTYGKDILERLGGYAVEEHAGTPWKYQGGNTLLLQEILLTVVDVPLGVWFAERIWEPLGATAEARWSIDNRGHERNYCCFYTTAPEFARFGQLLLDSGKVGGKTILDPDFVERMTTPVGPLEDGTDISFYGYQLWMGEHRGHVFKSLQGLHGQYVIAIPDLDLVAVRTGFYRPKGKVREIDVDVYSTIDLAMAAARVE